MFDRFFKLALLILAAAFLIVYHQVSQGALDSSVPIWTTNHNIIQERDKLLSTLAAKYNLPKGTIENIVDEYDEFIDDNLSDICYENEVATARPSEPDPW